MEGPQRTLSFEELARAAGKVAGALQNGDGPVAVALEPGEDWLIALHACLLAGKAVQPIDLRLSAAEQKVRARGAGRVIDSPIRGDDSPAPRPIQLGAAAAVMHTSGTTAEPKQVHLTHGNFLASALASAVMLGLDPRERWLCPMPLTHVGGLSVPIRSAIYGTTVVLHGRFDVAAVLEDLMNPERRITLVSLVPTMLSRLLASGLQKPPTLRWALLGGGPIAPALLERAAAAGVPVAPTYGMTEACSQIATFGWPLPGVDVRLESEANDQAAGEILVRGPIVSPGSVAADGWLRTGDLGQLDERGRLSITGRAADTIVTGGENVSPSEVEAVLQGHPAVVDAGVWARPDAEWGERIVASVVLRSGRDVPEDDLRTFCRERLAGYKVPKEFRAVESLPRTASGKLLRRQLS